MTVSDLPTLNAALNALATVLLVVGWTLIRRRRRNAHRNTMIAAFVVSVLFLTSYLVYHFNAGSTPFRGPASLRGPYLAVLLSHIVLAAAVPPLCLITLYRAWTGQFQRHRRIARVTFPIWLYVSVTGVLIYVVLYRLYPGA